MQEYYRRQEKGLEINTRKRQVTSNDLHDN